MSDAVPAAEPVERPPVVTLGALFFGFLWVALSGFGGVLPWARRMIVERRRWLNDREFTDILGLCQFLPGPNIVNVSVAVGQRFQGLAGSIVAFFGLISAPFVIVITLGVLYSGFGRTPTVKGALAGVSAAAAGLVVGMALKMAAGPVRDPRAAIVIAIAFVGVGVMRWPLAWALLGLVPFSILVAWLAERWRT